MLLITSWATIPPKKAQSGGKTPEQVNANCKQNLSRFCSSKPRLLNLFLHICKNLFPSSKFQAAKIMIQ